MREYKEVSMSDLLDQMLDEPSEVPGKTKRDCVIERLVELALAGDVDAIGLVMRYCDG